MSADGNKSDIRIVEGKKNIELALKEFKEKNYTMILIQEYLNYDMEYAMMGYSVRGKVLIPGINSNDFIFPSNRGNTSYARMFPLKDFKYDVSKIIKMLEKINYTGMFEVEMFLFKDKIYLNEINFRNSANLYGYTGNKIKYVYLYILDLLKIDSSTLKRTVDKSYHFCIEPLHIKNVFLGVTALLAITFWNKCAKALAPCTITFNVI